MMSDSTLLIKVSRSRPCLGVASHFSGQSQDIFPLGGCQHSRKNGTSVLGVC